MFCGGYSEVAPGDFHGRVRRGEEMLEEISAEEQIRSLIYD
jgi:hypothetical protein